MNAQDTMIRQMSDDRIELRMEIEALRAELERLQPTTCNKYVDGNLCLKKKGHEGECEWFPF